MNNWLESFALVHLPSHLLHSSEAVFRAAKEGQGQAYLRTLSANYAQKKGHNKPAQKCLELDFTDRYAGFEALIIQVWPCLQLNQPPVFLAAVRQEGYKDCRLFRLHYHYFTDKQVSLSEIALYEKAQAPLHLPTYQEATALIFSCTLATSCFQKEILEQRWKLPSLYSQNKLALK